MQLADYVTVLVKRWWVVALTLLAAAATAYAVSKLLPPTYRAQAVYLAFANQADNGLNIVLRNSMNSYRELVMQPDVLDQISQSLGLDVSGERWMEDVNINLAPMNRRSSLRSMPLRSIRRWRWPTPLARGSLLRLTVSTPPWRVRRGSMSSRSSGRDWSRLALIHGSMFWPGRSSV